MDVPFETVNVLEADAIRSGMKEYSAWPTFPQVGGGGLAAGTLRGGRGFAQLARHGVSTLLLGGRPGVGRPFRVASA